MGRSGARVSLLDELQRVLGIDHSAAAAWRLQDFAKRDTLLRDGQGTMEMDRDGLLRVVVPDLDKSVWTHEHLYYLHKDGSPIVPAGP